MSTPITAPQRRAIFAIAREQGMDNDLLHAAVKAVTKKQSLKDLTKTEARRVIDHLKNPNQSATRGNRRSRRLPPDVTRLATEQQKILLATLASQRPQMQTHEALWAFCHRVCGHDIPRTSQQISRCIEGLKALNRRDGLWVP